MNVKCPCCNHKFAVTEDDIFLDYSANYGDSEKCLGEVAVVEINVLGN